MKGARRVVRVGGPWVGLTLLLAWAVIGFLASG